MNVTEWLGENNKLGVDIWENKYRAKGESLDEWFDRVSGGDEETKQLIKDIFAELEQFQAVIPAIPAKDTIKMMNDDGTVQSTLDRSKLCMVQTPQAFHKDAIVKAFDTAINLGFLGTDDASIAEFCGIPVKVIPGLPENIKITDRQDLINAEKR